MSKKSLKTNFIYNLSVQIISLLAPFLISPYVSRTITVNGVGRFSNTYANASYFILIAMLGTSVYGQREIASNCNDKAKISKIFWEVCIVRLLSVAVSLIAYFSVFSYIGLSKIIIIQSINILGVAFDINWFFQGLEEFKVTSVRTMFIKLGFVVYILIFIKDEQDVELYALGYALLQVAANISLWLHVPKYLTKVKPDIRNMFRHLGPSFLLFVPAMATQIYTVLDKSMIGIFTDTDVQNGLYEQAEKISRISLTVYTAYGTVMAPRIAMLFGEGQKEKISEYLRNSIKIMWGIVLPLTAGVFAIAPVFIPWFFGEDFTDAVPILRIFSLLIIPVGLSNVFAVQYLVPVKKQNVFTVSVIVGAIANFGMNMILIPRYYAIGAAVASVAAETIITGIQMIYVVFVCRCFKLRDIFIPSFRYVIYSGIMFLAVYELSLLFAPGLIGSVVIVAAGIVIYGILLLITKDNLIKSIRKN